MPPSIRKDYHKRCNDHGHLGYGKQLQTCKQCVYDTAQRCFDGGLTKTETYSQVRAIAGCYWCPFCLYNSVKAKCFDASTPLRRLKYCEEHQQPFRNKQHLRWRPSEHEDAEADPGTPETVPARDGGDDPFASDAYLFGPHFGIGPVP